VLKVARNFSFLLFVSAVFLGRPAGAISGCDVGCGALGPFPETAMENCGVEADVNCDESCQMVCGGSELGGNWDGCDSAVNVGTLLQPVYQSECRCFCQADLEEEGG
jgi:hypothetical protein